jgi:hypothetical protein
MRTAKRMPNLAVITKACEPFVTSPTRHCLGNVRLVAQMLLCEDCGAFFQTPRSLFHRFRYQEANRRGRLGCGRQRIESRDKRVTLVQAIALNQGRPRCVSENTRYAAEIRDSALVVCDRFISGSGY